MESRTHLSPDAVVALDLDGVIWRGRTPIPGSGEAVARLRGAGHRVAFVTNNSARPVGDVLSQLADCGIAATAHDVVGSAEAAVHLVAAQCAPGARVLAAAGPGVVEALAAAGFEVVREGTADAVVVGWHRDFDFDRLTVAMRAIRAGACFIATNTDATYPTETGLLPGGGAIVAAIATASGVEPMVAGKPHAPMAALVRDRFGTRGVMVGDRIDTDGAFAAELDWLFALVLSGVTESVPQPRPAFVAHDLAEFTSQLLAAAP
ncbi:MAG: HAD-IIA family hydrolase [Acidimicrobiia bacterium]